MTRRSAAPRKPWARANAKKRQLSPDERWAAALRERMLAACHPPQRAAVMDPGRRISVVVGRGGGKTTMKRVRAVDKLAHRTRGKVIYFATTRPQAELLNWLPLKEMLERLGEMDNFALSESKMRCTCKRTGAFYQMVGADDKGEVEKWRGQPFDEVQLDEAASHGGIADYLVDRIIGPRLGERDHSALVIGGTPGHILAGLFYEATRPGSKLHRPWSARELPEYANWTRWSSHAWNLRDIAALPDAETLYKAQVALWREALIEKEAQQWSDDHPIWLREYLGIWSEDNTETVFRYRAHVDGKPWNRWNPHSGALHAELKEHNFARPDLSLAGLREALGKLPKDVGNFMHVVANDMGTSDPFACNVLSFAPRDEKRRIWHTFAFERKGMYAKPIAELLIGAGLRAMAPAGLFGVLGSWPVGLTMDGDLATIEELANVYGVRCKKSERKQDYKMGAVELVNGDLVEGPRILVIEDSPLERQLLQLQWKMDDNGRPKENKAQANHSSDTLIYGRLEIAHLFDAGIAAARAGPRPYSDPQGLGGSSPPVPVTPSAHPPSKEESYESDRAPGTYDDPFA